MEDRGLRKMTNSHDIVDKKLLDLLVIKQAHQKELNFGFKNTVTKLNKQFTLRPGKEFEENKHGNQLDVTDNNPYKSIVANESAILFEQPQEFNARDR